MRRHRGAAWGWKFYFYYFQSPSPRAARVNERSQNHPDPSLARAHRVSSIVVIVVRLEIFALSKSARFFFGYWSDRAGRAL